jgi:hypothetical protein
MDVFMLPVSTILDSSVHRRVNNTHLYDYFIFLPVFLSSKAMTIATSYCFACDKDEINVLVSFILLWIFSSPVHFVSGTASSFWA